MARSDDDDALDWGDGSDDPTYAAGPATRTPAVDPGRTRDRDGYASDGEALDGDDTTADRAAEAAASGSALLVVYGIFAGVYLLYVIGWIIGVQRDSFTSPNLFFEVMYQFGEFSAILSPVLWFALTIILTRTRVPVVRLVWLVLGMVVVAPLPFLLSGTAA